MAEIDKLSADFDAYIAALQASNGASNAQVDAVDAKVLAAAAALNPAPVTP